MGNANSGRIANGGPLAEKLDDARFELIDAQKELQQALVLLHHAEAFVRQAERREERATGRLTLVMKELGYTGLRASELLRVEGLTVRVANDPLPGIGNPIGDPTAVAKFVADVKTDARQRAAARRTS